MFSLPLRAFLPELFSNMFVSLQYFLSLFYNLQTLNFLPQSYNLFAVTFKNALLLLLPFLLSA